MREHLTETGVESRKAVVCAWLEQNIAYSRNQIKRAVASRDGDKVRDWETWRSFSEHALGEVQSGMLDLWMANMQDPKFDPTLVDESDTSFGEA